MAEQLLQKPVQTSTAIGGNFPIDEAIIAGKSPSYTERSPGACNLSCLRDSEQLCL